MKDSKMDRRSFIKRTTFAAAAAAPFFVAKDLFANGSPNEKVNVGIIGIGKQVGVHFGSYLGIDECRITAVCDVDTARTDYAKQRIEGDYKNRGHSVEVKTFRDFRQMLADPSIDAVSIVTPDHWHAIMSILAARAGKHVYCEKPLTFTIQEGEQIVKAVKAAGVVFQTGSQQRSETSFRNAVQLARTGMLGDIKAVFCGVPWRFPVFYNWPAEELPSTMDWEMWVGPAPMRPYTSHLLHPLLAPNAKGGMFGYAWGEWRWHYDYGNGMQGDWGAHHFDIAQWGLNMDGKGPKYIRPYTAQNPGNVHDKRSLFYEYENGIRVFYGSPSEHLKKLGASNLSPMVTFIGNEGTACASRGGFFWASSPSLMNVKLPAGAEAAYTNGLGNHQRNFIEGILTGRPTLCPVETGVSSSNMCIMGTIAHRLGRTLEWDWKKSTFVNDPEAVALMWRENRGEWAKVF